MEPVLIATNSTHGDICAIQSFTLDMVIGHDRQDFTACFEPIDGIAGGSLVYIDGTEYGGVIDDVTTDTESGLVEYHGRTWDGVLACKRIMPPDGSAYRTASGEANSALASLVTLLGIGDVFAASTEDSGITVDYQFARFCDAYSGIYGMLESAGAKLKVRREGGKTVMSAEHAQAIADEADSDLIDFTLTKTNRTVNHLVCAGEGEGTERVVIHLYADAAGNVSQTQTLFGIDEITDFYDYNNADATELLEEGAKKLQGYQTQGSLDITGIGRGEWDVGDTLVARDNKNGMTVTAPIVGKTVTVNSSTNWHLHVEYEVGEASRTATSPSGTAELPEKVNRDGDTMTGALVADDVYFVAKSENIDRDGPNPSATTNGNGRFFMRDKDGEFIGQMRLVRETNGCNSLQLMVGNENTSGSEVTNTIGIRVDTDGVRSYTLSDAAAFCEALHVGDFVGKDQTANVSMANSGYTNVTSINVTAGVWVVYANIAWASNATGRRYAYISTASASSNGVRVASCNAVSGGTTYQNIAGVTVLSATTTFYLVGWQNSGAALNATGYLRAVRIK